MSFGYEYTMSASERRLIRRRWYLFVLGLVAACFVIVAAGSQPHVYVAEARVALSPPVSVATSRPYGSYADTMLAFTGTVDRVYNGDHPSIQLSTPQATLFGNGVREGVSVAALKNGNQWRSWQDQPVIVVKASAPSEAEALTTLETAIGDVVAITSELQVSSGVPQPQHITAHWDEREFIVESFGSSRDSTLKGAGVIGALAVALSALVASGLDRAAAIRRQRRTPSPTAARRGWVSRVPDV